jgi:hypothetical protein
MANRKQLKQLATIRLREAEALFAAGLYDGCAYLCGYIIELALKARICRLLNLSDYPETGKLKERMRFTILTNCCCCPACGEGAVLPFENLSRDPDNAYFTEGIAGDGPS